MVNYRPYKNAEEFLQAWKEHGPFFKITKYDGKKPDGFCSISAFFNHRVSFFLTDVDEKRREFEVVTAGLSYEEFLDSAIWSDGTPCGVKEEKDKTCLEIINNALAQINNCGSLYTIEDVKYGKPFESTPCYLISSDGNAYLGCFEDGQFKVAHFTSGEGHEGDVKWRQRIYYTPTTNVVAYIPYDIQ